MTTQPKPTIDPAFAHRPRTWLTELKERNPKPRGWALTEALLSPAKNGKRF